MKNPGANAPEFFCVQNVNFKNFVILRVAAC